MKPAARRALTRMAWRDIKRNRWRSLLVIVMIALPNGSAPNTRRFVAGYRAMLLAGLAGWLAIPAGFLPVTLIQLASRQDYPFVVPWTAFAVVGIMLPLIAGAVGALFSRRPPTAQMLRPIA
jgi:hypothetical protein